MNCSDWQAMIAAEDPGARAHLDSCGECRAFERELAENAAALRGSEIHPGAYAAVRARVLAEARHRPARWMWPVAIAAAMVVASTLGLVRWTAPLRAPVPPGPEAIVYRVAPPDVVVPVEKPRVHMGPEGTPNTARMGPEGTPYATKRQEPLTAIKLLTDDPNVVIIWLVDSGKKGDSL